LAVGLQICGDLVADESDFAEQERRDVRVRRIEEGRDKKA
jgi:hypothetical protein